MLFWEKLRKLINLQEFVIKVLKLQSKLAGFLKSFPSLCGLLGRLRASSTLGVGISLAGPTRVTMKTASYLSQMVSEP